ncbi:acyltransferase [Scytonema sp. UIC 10036]|uniref:acyltransferase n=1 Tax=Scytonema sp. UIC 10036 TaxID=2304196 RepID=UPI0012DA66EC|nr:acyltransferase [Scytonema sp. UIC 10036]MUG93830.1 acyltransferase [Scytonema sp. UIC 10036]
MNDKQFISKYKRLEEMFLTTLLGDVPTILLGTKLRNIMYKSIFGKLGNSVYIHNGVEFISTRYIEIGNGVYLFKDVRIHAGSHQNNRVCLADGVILEKSVEIGALDNTQIHIGERTFIGSSVCIGGPGNITIGKDCLIASHAGIVANNHIFDDPTQKISSQGITRKGITIEDDCWLGHAVTVLDGVTIGKGSVIGAGAVVTKDIPSYSVAVGIPAKVIRQRTSKDFVKSRN